MSDQRNDPTIGRSTSDIGVASSVEEPDVGRTDPVAAQEQIRMRAYKLYLERGSGPTNDVEDWLRAEREHAEQTTQVAENTAEPGVAAT